MNVSDIHACLAEDTGQVARNMADNLIRRLPALSHEHRLGGIICLGNSAQADDSDTSAALLRSVTVAH